MLPAFVVAVLLWSGPGFAACPTGHSNGHSKNCVNFDFVPQISRQVSAGDPSAPVARPVPVAGAKTPYTGPTVGLSPTVRKTPTVGYRWAIN
jgi:hypothetical protein